MTFHVVRLYVEPPKGEGREAVENWVTNYSEWSGSATKHGLVSYPPDGEERYLTGFWRFEEQGETPSGILQRLYDNLSTYQSGLWFRAFYHICDHDADGNFGDCPVADYAAEYGNVHDEIKDIPTDATVVVSG